MPLPQKIYLDAANMVFGMIQDSYSEWLASDDFSAKEIKEVATELQRYCNKNSKSLPDEDPRTNAEKAQMVDLQEMDQVTREKMVRLINQVENKIKELPKDDRPFETVNLHVLEGYLNSLKKGSSNTLDSNEDVFDAVLLGRIPDFGGRRNKDGKLIVGEGQLPFTTETSIKDPKQLFDALKNQNRFPESCQEMNILLSKEQKVFPYGQLVTDLSNGSVILNRLKENAEGGTSSPQQLEEGRQKLIDLCDRILANADTIQAWGEKVGRKFDLINEHPEFVPFRKIFNDNKEVGNNLFGDRGMITVTKSVATIKKALEKRVPVTHLNSVTRLMNYLDDHRDVIANGTYGLREQKGYDEFKRQFDKLDNYVNGLSFEGLSDEQATEKIREIGNAVLEYAAAKEKFNNSYKPQPQVDLAGLRKMAKEERAEHTARNKVDEKFKKGKILPFETTSVSQDYALRQLTQTQWVNAYTSNAGNRPTSFKDGGKNGVSGSVKEELDRLQERADVLSNLYEHLKDKGSSWGADSTAYKQFFKSLKDVHEFNKINKMESLKDVYGFEMYKKKLKELFSGVADKSEAYFEKHRNKNSHSSDYGNLRINAAVTALYTVNHAKAQALKDLAPQKQYKMIKEGTNNRIPCTFDEVRNDEIIYSALKYGKKESSIYRRSAQQVNNTYAEHPEIKTNNPVEHYTGGRKKK